MHVDKNQNVFLFRTASFFTIQGATPDGYLRWGMGACKSVEAQIALATNPRNLARAKQITFVLAVPPSKSANHSALNTAEIETAKKLLLSKGFDVRTNV
jgi:hypothetical protein